MKNIYILPTDKPSKLGFDSVEKLHFVNDYIDDYQNIYITSDEEIKEGDWIYHSNKEKIFQVNSNKAYSGTQNITLAFVQKYDTCKKIILTTDQDLIKDGVQAIDDEFLEWFVKNTSCETIKVNHYGTCCGNSFISQCINCEKYKPVYKIIIPKEEPKQCDICKRYPKLEGTNKCESCYSVVRHVLEQDPRFKNTLLPDLRKKEETLEEAAREYYKRGQLGFEKAADTEKAFLKGGIWQQERMYSEEEVGELVYNIIGEYGKHYGIMIDGSKLNELFEQFKKK